MKEDNEVIGLKHNKDKSEWIVRNDQKKTLKKLISFENHINSIKNDIAPKETTDSLKQIGIKATLDKLNNRI
jgi:hypothetical protein